MRNLMSKLLCKKEVLSASEARVEKAMTKQAAQITKVLAQLDTLNRKAGN